jgi:hypothetical protein
MLKKIVRGLERRRSVLGAGSHCNRSGFGSVSRRVGKEEQTAAQGLEGSARENGKGTKTSLEKSKTRQEASQVKTTSYGSSTARADNRSALVGVCTPTHTVWICAAEGF